MDRLGLGHATLRARQPRLVYASITGYGSSGPWTHRRAYAPVVGAEAGITKAQGDARGSAYTNDPFSHADVYTALEAATAIVAALYRREQTGEGCWIDVSMAQTMLYVNEHLHDQLYDGDVDPGWIRSFAPGDYLVVQTANGDLVTISGHPAERGTFELFVAAFGLDELATSERFANVPTPDGELRRAARAHRARGGDVRRRRRSGGAARPARARRRQGARRHASWPSRRGRTNGGRSRPSTDRRGGTIRIPNPPWRFDDVAGEITGEPRYRGEDNRAVLGELLGYDDARDRRAGGVRRPVQPPAAPLKFVLGGLRSKPDLGGQRPGIRPRSPPRSATSAGDAGTWRARVGHAAHRRAAARDAAAHPGSRRRRPAGGHGR